ncbi:MAG: cation:proton antiporter, partial [Pseudomonadota bacterium]
MSYSEIALIAGFAMLYSSIAGALERLPVNGPLVFVAFGFALGPYGFGWFAGDMSSDGLRLVAEITLALVLFVDASRSDLKVLARYVELPQRLILLALPLVILLGIPTGLVIEGGLDLMSLAILAVIVAPTDAALGKPVVVNPRVPAEIREGLNVESGLNDGVCVPIFLALLAAAAPRAAMDAEAFSGLAAGLFLQEIGIGAAVGAAVAALAAAAVYTGVRNRWTNDHWLQIPVVGAAVACFAAAQALHGSGFIAAFVGGLLFGRLARRHPRARAAAAEGAGDVFAMLTWITFGAAIVGQVWGAVSWSVALYALLSLTAVRMLAVALALIGFALPPAQMLFIGWFGPRGLA